MRSTLRRTERPNAGVPPDRFGWTPPTGSYRPTPPATNNENGGAAGNRDMDRNSVSSMSNTSTRSNRSARSLKRRQLEAEARAKEDLLKLEKEQIEKLAKLEREAIERRLAYEKSMAEIETDLDDDDSQKLSEDEEEDLRRRYNLLRFGPILTSTKNDQSDPISRLPSPSPEEVEEQRQLPLTKTKVKETSNDSVTMPELIKALESLRSGSASHAPSASDDMKKFVARQSTARELPKFSGNVDDWPSFKSQFERSTALCKFSDDENLFRLQRSLVGKAKEAVQSMLLVPGNVPSILKTLEKNFGEPEFIVESLLEKVKKAPCLKEGKWSGIRDLSNLVRNLKDTLKVLMMESHQRNPQLLQDLSAKLTPQLQHDWLKVRLGTKEENRLETFSNWLSDTADAYNHISKPYFESPDDKKSSKKLEKNSSGKTLKKKEKSKDDFEETSWHLGTTTEMASKKSYCICCQKVNHVIKDCFKFKNLDVDKRWEFVTGEKVCFSCLKPSHGIKSCKEKRKCEIDGCTFPHHPLLHKPKAVKPSNSTSGISKSAPGQTEEPAQTQCHQFIPNKILSKVVPVLLSGPAGQIHTHAFLDEGSEVTLIDSMIADHLGLIKILKPLSIRWSDGTLRTDNDSCAVRLQISGLDEKRIFDINEARTVKSLQLGQHSVNLKDLTTRWPHLRKTHLIPLKNAKPSILIGSDNAFLIAFDKVMKGPQNAPLLGRTPLGWMVTGNASELYSGDQNKVYCSFQSCDEELHQAMKDYFRVESLGVKILPTRLSKEEVRARTLMDLNTRRVQGGWETGLLWKTDDVQMPPSYDQALKRLYHLEKKMDSDPNFCKQYQNRMNYNLSQGYARLLNQEEAKTESPKSWYLPHFGVCHPQKPGKIRIVFDAAAKSHGKSLNDQLLTGPDLLTSLTGTLLKFRQKEIGFSGDIRDMFHRVKIRKEDIPAQKFLWRGQNRIGKPDVYVFTVSIFGASCSPYTSQEVKNRNAREFMDIFPAAVMAITEKHYMDNYVDCTHRPSEAIRIIQDVINIHGKGGFEMREFSCSSREVWEQIPESLRSTESKELTFTSELKTERILGLIWNPNCDELTFNMKFPRIEGQIFDSTTRPTKRQVLKVVMSVFDPMGYLGNFTVQGKILLQDIWRSGLGWDDNLTESLMGKWAKWVCQLSSITNLKIKRCFAPDMTNITNLSLHIFCDASEKAYAAVAYLRIETPDLTTATIAMSKTRVAPLKPLSIPRLELQAALMGSRLADFIRQQLELKIQSTYFWTDSSTVLHWIRSDARNFKTFVAHRLGEILETTDQSQWRWVPTKDNVADEATRDNSQVIFNPNSRWVRGPNYLCLPKDCWPKESNFLNETKNSDLELKGECVFLCIDHGMKNVIDSSRHSTWTKLIRVTGWFLRSSRIWLEKIRSKVSKFSAELSVTEIKAAEDFWIKQIQSDSFGQEIAALKSGALIPRGSRLKCLTPILDTDGILRLRGRIDASKLLENDTKRPIILDSKHSVTKLLINDYHVKAGHHGLERVFNDLRQKYWILDIRSAVKRAFGACQLCKNRRAKPIVPEMGSLPPPRLIGKISPFTNCGVDYFGPMFVTVGRKREKRYGVLFTCMATRAVHLEIAHSLTTDSAIMAIRRMISRRGAPVRMYSDNGTNLKGADTELRSALLELDQEKLTRELTMKGIDWKFIPPAAPHMGGSWERLVQSVKIALMMTLKEHAPKEETLQTFMTEAENTVNSRPLTHVSVDPDDLESLTPNHFLRGTSSSAATPIGEFGDDDFSLRKQWRISQRLADLFWKRWVREYLPSLTRREKWQRQVKPVKVGDIVFIVDPDLPRNTWKRGIISSVHPGKDGIVRVVDVKTANSLYRRPVAKICVLDVLSDVAPLVPTSEGRNVSDGKK